MVGHERVGAALRYCALNLNPDIEVLERLMAELYAGKSLTEESVQEILMDKPADEPGEQSRRLGEPAPDDLFYVYFVRVGHETTV